VTSTVTSDVTRKKVGVLLSGRGSNFQALLSATRGEKFPAEIALVLSNRADAGGLAIAAAAGIPARCIDHRLFRGDRPAHEAAIATAFDEAGVEIVCLAGYMRLLTPGFVARYQGRMLNVHPSLLPAFPGLDTHARAIAAGVKLHGCTVHLVTDVMDEGPILAQAAVPVLADDTPDTLAARVLAQEHALYPAALAQFASGIPAPAPAADAALRNPLPGGPPLP
jgi:formyltetrahydrofolate-dependent phosphoribosylglycinamide formyltransferase